MDQNNQVISFSAKLRQKNLKKLKSESFDILIIGGGITGAGVARDAAMRGYKVALLESRDFAEGTSSRSSKLIHGGIRYLENKEFKLVFEALNERNKLFEMAPHLTHPLRFMIPLFKNSRVGMTKMGLGMWLYDMLSLFQAPELHERLDSSETLNRMPIVKKKDLLGSFIYSDGYMDDDRIVFETLRSATQAGAIAANYTKVLQTKNKTNAFVEVEVQDQISGSTFSLKARHVVSSTGPWTDLVGPTLVEKWKQMLRPTKGIHITLPKNRLPLTSAVVMGAEKSDRIVFAIPRHEMIIIGTTDTDFQKDPSEVNVTKEDIEYLLKITNDYFPQAAVTPKDIIGSYAGVRPLVHDDASTEGKTSREHKILHVDKKFTFVAGGKYTTYRKMSEDIVNQIWKFFSFEKTSGLKKCETDRPLNPLITTDSYEEAIEKSNTELEHKLARRHGIEGYSILKKYSKIAKNYWEYEAGHAIDEYMCLNLKDFFVRRTPLILSEARHGTEFIDGVAQVFQTKLGYSDEEIQQQKEDLLAHIKKEFSWKTSFK